MFVAVIIMFPKKVELQKMDKQIGTGGVKYLETPTLLAWKQCK